MSFEKYIKENYDKDLLEYSYLEEEEKDVIIKEFKSKYGKRQRIFEGGAI